VAARPDDAAVVAHHQRRAPRPSLALGLLAAAVLSFAGFAGSRMLPAQPYGIAVDWRVFYAAATVVGQGGNPYDPAQITTAEQAADHYPVAQPAIDDFANPAPVAWALQPLAALPFWVSYAVLAALSLAAAAVALALWLRSSGWRRPGRWAVVALLSWPSLLGVFNGQFDLLLLAMTLGAIALSAHRHPGLAGGLCAAAALVKPHILWPLPLLLVAAQAPDRRAAARCAVAALATAAAVTAGGELLMPGSTAAFVAHLLGFGSRVNASQPDLAGIPGLVAHVPGGALMGAAIAIGGVVGTLAFAGWWVGARGPRSLPAAQRAAIGACLGLAIWLAATPYAHPNDDVLLFPLVALVIGRDAATTGRRQLGWCLAGAVGMVIAFPLSPLAGGALLVAVAAAAWIRRNRADADAGWLASASLVGLAVLPMAWPFHLSVVSLTPVAVLLVAIAGGAMLRRQLAVRAGCSRACAPAP
jgi:hypothetical protein